mgnify:CR=1 FL=1
MGSPFSSLVSSIKVDDNRLPFVKSGDILKIKYQDEKEVTTIKDIKEIITANY